MELRTIQRKITEAYPGLILAKGVGYFYFTSDNIPLGEALASLYTTAVYVNRIGQLSERQWMDEAYKVMYKVRQTAHLYTDKELLELTDTFLSNVIDGKVKDLEQEATKLYKLINHRLNSLK